MAYEGELVRMENGRWARFQLCSPCSDRPPSEQIAILVAVELDERFQELLNATAQSSLDALSPEMMGDARPGAAGMAWLPKRIN